MDFSPIITPNQLMTIIILQVLTALPCNMILKRLRFSGWWALTCFVPIAAILFLWYLALARWPGAESANAPQLD